MYAIVFGKEGINWGKDRTEALFTVYVPYLTNMKVWCEAYGDTAPISTGTYQNEMDAREVAMRGLMAQPIDTAYKARLWAWQLGGFEGDPPSP